MKNRNDTIGNRTRYLPAYNAVPHSTAPPNFFSVLDAMAAQSQGSLHSASCHILQRVGCVAKKILTKRRGTMLLEFYK